MDDIEVRTFHEKFSFDLSTAFNEVYFQWSNQKFWEISSFLLNWSIFWFHKDSSNGT